MPAHSSLGNILIVDDDKTITDLLSLNFKTAGYTVNVIERTSGVDLSALRDIHLVIVDCSRQTPAGCELIAAMRSVPAGARVGVIYCSNLASERSLIDALDAGADDVVRKPFSLREMLARVRAVLRRRCRAVGSAAEADVIDFRRMKVDLVLRSVSLDGESLNLSNTEFAILELLLRNIGTYTSRITIFRHVWPESAGANERIVDTNISRLRRKLGPIGSCIVNRSGLGYMLAE